MNKLMCALIILVILGVTVAILQFVKCQNEIARLNDVISERQCKIEEQSEQLDGIHNQFAKLMLEKRKSDLNLQSCQKWSKS